MIPYRWRTAAQQLNGRSQTLVPRIPTAAAGSRTCFRPRTSTLPSARVLVSQSRAFQPIQLPLCHQLHRLSTKRSSSSVSPTSSLLDGPILQSAFPTKTVLALVAVGALIYYLVDIDDTPPWAISVLEAFRGDAEATPLHFYKDRDEVDHWIQYHIPDPSIPMRDPEILNKLNERFAEIAFGWEVEGEDAVEQGLPVTHGCRFRSNEPCEDYFALGTAPGPGSKPWNYWSIFDGHAGRHTAYYLQWTLHPNLSRALSNLSPTSSSAVIASTIKDVFLKLDNELMTRARHAANWYPAANAAAISALTCAFSGSCALLAAFDPEASKLRVACVGDSRAVLGRWDPLAEKYTAMPLSIDQTGFNAAEVSRLADAHPDEPDIIDPKTGRLLGIAVTRAFGDHRWKWDNDFVKQVQLKFWGTPPRPGSKTPPYMTAEPEISETDIVRADPKAPGYASTRSDFMIMASDGLWDRISSDHAVACIHHWLDARARGHGKVSHDPHLSRPSLSPSLQLDPGVSVDVDEGQEIEWKATPEYFAIEDDNAAVCLARNAMGGTRRGLFVGLLSVPGPLSRMAVDDTTVMVVFFERVEGKKGREKEGGKRRWWFPFGSVSIETRGGGR